VNKAFVTGMLRSGTTLVEKVLHNHPRISIASQPFFFFYVALKEAFNRTHGLTPLMPLSTQFGPEAYPPQRLVDFLNEYAPTREELQGALHRHRAAPYRESLVVTERLADEIQSGGGLMPAGDLIDRLHTLVGEVYPKEALAFVGSKEVLCEEYIPFFLSRGWKVVLVIRDVRDVIASLDAPGGARWTGAPRPTLYNIRNWRKSVTYASQYGDDRNLLVCRYEDLIASHAGWIRLFGFLGVSPSGRYGQLFDQHGRPWEGNSSFGARRGVEAPCPADRKTPLNRAERLFVQKLTLTELQSLGYEVGDLEETAAFDLRHFRERPTERPEFAEFLRRYDKELAAEEQRFETLLSQPATV